MFWTSRCAAATAQGVEIFRDATLDMWESELQAEFTPKARYPVFSRHCFGFELMWMTRFFKSESVFLESDQATTEKLLFHFAEGGRKLNTEAKSKNISLKGNFYDQSHSISHKSISPLFYWVRTFRSRISFGTLPLCWLTGWGTYWLVFTLELLGRCVVLLPTGAACQTQSGLVLTREATAWPRCGNCWWSFHFGPF